MSALPDAQRRMQVVSIECKQIVALFMRSYDPDLTIETLTEDRLASILGSREQHD
jgi:hypothetical protein